MPDNKYTTKITVQNDSVTIVGNIGAYYSPSDNAIYMHKGDVSWEDFGKQNPNALTDDLTLIHERQHQINTQKGAYAHTVSLHESYNRNVHDEITALIAEKLEIRRQYKACKTEKDKAAFFARFAKDEANAEYINALKSGKINPNSTSSKDFTAEMAFIKDSSTRYRADPNDSGYAKQWTSIAMQNLAENSSNARSNPTGLAEDIRKMYQIGGFDFNTVGTNKAILLQNQAVIAADNMLAQKADPQKLLRFMQSGQRGMASRPYAIAEKLNVTGLSKEQAEKVILTAITTQQNAEMIAEQLCLGETPKMNFYNRKYDGVADYLRNEIAPYMDVKADIWEKNNMLTAEGNEEKFQQLMQQAQTVTLDPQAWFDEMGSMLRRDVYDINEVKARIAEYQGKTINVKDVVSNMDEFALPFDEVSLEETLAAQDKKAAEDKAFWEEYYQKHPEEKEKRLSDPYEVDVMDLNSDMLKDELQNRKEEERKVEPLYASPQIKSYTPFGDGLMMEIKNPEYQTAELSRLTAADGTTKDVALINGQKHGAEITRDAEGNITELKVYDHGKEIDLAKNRIDIKTAEQNGIKSEYIELNGEKFGAEILTDTNGKSKAAFYEQGGLMITGSANAQITKTEGEFHPAADMLKNELHAQQGGLPEQPAARAQNLRFDLKLDAPTLTPELFGRKKEENAAKETPLFTIPLKPDHTR